MRRFANTLSITLSLLCSAHLLAALPSSALAQRPGEGKIAEAFASGPDLAFEPLIEADAWLLTVSGPQGFNLSREFQFGEPIHLILEDELGPAPDGAYTYELQPLTLWANGGLPDRSENRPFLAQSASFGVIDGAAVLNQAINSSWEMAVGSGFAGMELIDSNTAQEVARFSDGAPANSLMIDSSGEVGIGTATPASPLHVRRNDGSAKVLVQEASGTAAIRQVLEMRNNGGVGFQLTDSRLGAEAWQFQTNLAGNFSINNVADPSGGTELILFKDTGNVVIEGAVTAQSFTPVSDRSLKENIFLADGEEILRKVAQLPVSLWNFKGDQAELRHIGPMAQDFFASFGLGSSDRTINLLDASGVALAAIQGLDLEAARLRGQLSEQQKEIDSLKRELAELRALLESAPGR